jgi:hypothetical protein
LKRPLSPLAQQAAHDAERMRYSVRALLAAEPSVSVTEYIGYYAYAASFLRIRRELKNLPDPAGSIKQLTSVAKRRGLDERILGRIAFLYRFELPEN